MYMYIPDSYIYTPVGADDTNATRVPFTIRMTWPQKHQDMYVRKERERVLFKAPAASGGRGGVDNYIYGG